MVIKHPLCAKISTFCDLQQEKNIRYCTKLLLSVQNELKANWFCSFVCHTPHKLTIQGYYPYYYELLYSQECSYGLTRTA